MVHAAALPLAAALKVLPPRRARRFALTGGEDYELLFTVRRRKVAALDALRDALGCRVTHVGEITREAGVRVLGDGDIDPGGRGHQTFSRTRMSTTETVALLGFGFALAMWAALAGAEATLAEARIIARTPQGPRRLGRLFDELHRHPRRLLISLALGREIALVGTAALGVVVAHGRGGIRGSVVAILATAVLLLGSRGLAAGAASRRVASGRPTVMPALMLLLAPFTGIADLLKRVGRRLALIFLDEEPTGDNIFAPEELAALSEEGVELAASERTLVAKVVSFGDRPVRHVMTPRRDIIAVPVDVSHDELLRMIHTRAARAFPPTAARRTT